MKKSLSEIRTEYKKHRLNKRSLNPEPLTQLKIWLDEAIDAEVNEPTAMTIATSSADGKPSARIVLLKDIGQAGITFYTNYNSRKGKELADNPYAAAVLFWSELERQVRLEGEVSKISEEDSKLYFNSRPFESRISAAISPQSTVIPDRSYLEKRVAKLKESLTGKYVPKPSDWGGYLIKITSAEFWQGRENRLHDRIVYRKKGDSWEIFRLAP